MRYGRRDPFDFDITCPVIDGQIGEIREDVWQAIPANDDLADYDDKEVLADIMAKIAPHLEEVRETNIKMREAANEQIGELQTEVGDLKDEIASLKREIERLERKNQ